MIIETSYGRKEIGASRFVIVAPHAAGDDINTGEISDNVADSLKAYLIVNSRFVKPSNSHAQENGLNVEDFNHLSWNGQGYEWSHKKTQMREFYTHVEEYAQAARAQSSDGRAIVAYIHGMDDRPDFLAIDIGCGLKYHDRRLKGTQGTRDKHPAAGSNTGVPRTKREDAERLRSAIRDMKLMLEGEFESLDPRLWVGIGEYKAAWSRSNGIQYHAGTPDASFQLEINRTLRNDVEGASRIISNVLRQTYG